MVRAYMSVDVISRRAKRGGDMAVEIERRVNQLDAALSRAAGRAI